MKITIEVDNRGNSPVIFAPLQERLTCRWNFTNTLNRSISADAKGMRGLAMEFRDGIPGQCVQVDIEAFVGRVFYPQSLDKDLRRRVQAIYKAHPATLGPVPDFGDPREFKLGPDDMKEWLYAMSRMVETGLAVCVAGSGEMPTVAEVLKMPGKIEADPHFQGQKGGEGKGEPERYRNEVRLPKNYGVDHNATEPVLTGHENEP